MLSGSVIPPGETKEIEGTAFPAKPTLPTLEEIEEGLFLKPVTVHYANRAISGQYGIRLHGFPIVKSSPNSIKVPKNCFPKKPFILKQHYSNIYYLGSSFIHAPYQVSDNLLVEIEKTDSFTLATKKIMRSMKGKLFPTVEHFVREWALQSKKESGRKLSPELEEKIYAAATDPYFSIYSTEVDALLDLNQTLNDNLGAVLPIHPSTSFCVKDRIAFEAGDCTVRDYPLISPTVVYELFAQQQCFKNYMEEKLAMGHAVDFLTKLKPEIDTLRIMKRLVNFKYTTSDCFTANCNTATATLLQEAEYISAHNRLSKFNESKEEPEKITGASLCSIGSSQRMFFWNSRLHTEVINLFINKEYKKDDPNILSLAAELDKKPALLQKLADSKDYILRVFETWPTPHYKKALEQILDSNTPLGKVFLTQRSDTWRPPHLSRGALKKAAEKLAEINKMFKPTPESKERKLEIEDLSALKI